MKGFEFEQEKIETTCLLIARMKRNDSWQMDLMPGQR